MAYLTPGVLVEVEPTRTPPRFGLFTAADVQAMTDSHAEGGQMYLPPNTGVTTVVDVECDPDSGGDDLFDTFADELDWQFAPPITAYTGFTCKAPGVDWAQAESRLLSRLGSGEAPAVERTIWRGMAGRDDSAPAVGLMSDRTQVLNSGANAVDLVAGIGMLERWFYEQYPGTPVLHTPRQLAPRLAERRQVDTAGGQATTTLGSRWSFGAYPNTNVAGAAAAAGTAWIVASGQVVVERSDVQTQGTQFSRTGAGFSARDNRVLHVAYRTDVVRWDGITAAVLVNV